MATFNKFNTFTKELVDGNHDFDLHTFKVMLSNTLPIAANAVKTDITEIAAGSGYTAGGTASAMSTSTLSGTAKVVAADTTFTAAGGTIGPFRYPVLYNATNDKLIGWADYGSSITLADTEQFLTDFDATNGILQVT